MTKITVDKALIEQALMLANAVDRPNSRGSWNPTGKQLNVLRDALRAALKEGNEVGFAKAEPVVEPVGIEDLAHSALQEALSYGLGLDLFVRYFKTVQKASPPPPAEVPLLTTDDIRKVADKADEGQEPTEFMLAYARAIEQAVRQKAGLKCTTQLHG